MLREVDGRVESYFTDNPEEKKLEDVMKKGYRGLDRPVRDGNKKKDLQNRQKTASKLRSVKQKINNMKSQGQGPVK